MNISRNSTQRRKENFTVSKRSQTNLLTEIFPSSLGWDQVGKREGEKELQDFQRVFESDLGTLQPLN